MINRYAPNPVMHTAVEHEGTIYVGGVTANDLTAGMATQAKEALEKLEERLESAGSNKGRVLAATVYLTDMARKAEMNESWVAFFGEAQLPSRATIGVADLTPGVLIEIVAIAAR